MKDDWILIVFVTWFFVLTGLGFYQLQGDAASSGDPQDVALTTDAQAEIETKTKESVTDEAQRAQENLAREADAGAREAGPKRRSAESAMVAETSEQPEAQGSTDTDRDGVDDVRDRCEDTVAGMGVGADGCRLTGRLRDPVDKDEDQVADYLDKCPRNVEGAKVDEKGCAQIEKPLARLEDVRFESGRAALRSEAKETLTELVSILENNPDIQVRLKGYADNVGNESDNELLSRKRAESIKDYLVSEGIDGSRIKTNGLGESDPIATNETEQGRAQNRRVDIMRARADTMAGAGPQGTQSGLGTVEFPTSASSKEAQAHFVRGVAALHSFWYPVALNEFREASRMEPDFMMAYWGEAMAHDHPLWGDPQETQAGREVVEKIRISPELAPRERAWLNAVKVLYGEGSKVARDKAYAEAMEKIYRAYPDDAEAALFYALALMGSVRPEDPAGLQTRLRAGGIASQVFKQKPDHPGAAHYVIHAYDDPKHARMALDAARRYARLAPAAPHALHMPSHIFLQLGMWPKAAKANEAALARARKQGPRPVTSDQTYHSLHWLHYTYLQQGRYEAAKERLAQMRKALTETSADDSLQLYYLAYLYAQMAASFVVESERWSLAQELLQPLQILTQAKPPGTASAEGGAPPSPFIQAAMVSLRALPVFVRGLAAIHQRTADAQKSVAELRAIARPHGGAHEGALGPALKRLEIQALEVSAVGSAAKGDLDAAIEAMQKATAVANSLPPPSGPPEIIEPAHELFGEILLGAARPQEAAEQFAASLRRQPTRARSLLGAARALVEQSKRDAAAHAYAKFLQQWQQADAQWPALREAKEYALRASVGALPRRLATGLREQRHPAAPGARGEEPDGGRSGMPLRPVF